MSTDIELSWNPNGSDKAPIQVSTVSVASAEVEGGQVLADSEMSEPRRSMRNAALHARCFVCLCIYM